MVPFPAHSFCFGIVKPIGCRAFPTALPKIQLWRSSTYLLFCIWRTTALWSGNQSCSSWFLSFCSVPSFLVSLHLVTYRAHVLAYAVEDNISLPLIQLMSSQEFSSITHGFFYDAAIRMHSIYPFPVESISSFPTIRCILILLICLSPLIVVSSLFHDVFPDWSCFLISVSSSFLLSQIGRASCRERV